MNEMVLVVDFGGQYNQLIARRVRESHVYSEIVSYKKAFEAIREKQPRGIILTGGPNSVYLPDSPTIGKELFGLGVPVPQPSWGMLAQEGASVFQLYPHQLWIPAIAISLTMLSFNLLGDGLRDAFDPRLRR